MLEPRVSDLPAVFLFLVVLPMVVYFLLGRCYETSQKKSRIGALAQFASEEAVRVETVPPPFDAIPTESLSTSGVHECARCFAPATNRCSRCKSIRYCSGHCQIAHWRLVHKHECQLRQDNTRPFTPSGSSTVRRSNSKESRIHQRPKPVAHGFESSYECDANSDTSTGPYFCYDVDTANTTVETFHVPELGNIKADLFPGSSPLPTEESPMETSPACEVIDGTCSASSDLSGSSESSSPMFSSGADFASDAEFQSHKTTDDVKITQKSRNSRPMSAKCAKVENVISETDTGRGSSSRKSNIHKGVYTSSDECLNSSLSSKRSIGEESIYYKKHPYTTGNADPLLHRSVKKMQKEHTAPEILKNAFVQSEYRNEVYRNASTGIESTARGSSISGIQKSSKDPKRSLIGLINHYKSNKVLFLYEDFVKLFQCEACYIFPRGLLNCGNSCFANAVLQCLMRTKPLMVYLLQRMHSKTCSVRDWCLMCELEQHVSMLREGGGPLSPIRILSNMRNGGWTMCGGNQEDAHEFLRLLVMSLQSICLEGLGGEKNIDPRLQETTLIQQIFGGRLKSKVKCMKCHHESEIYENIMDLTLEIHGSESLEDALRQFTSVEDLNGDNMYKCGRCYAYVNARKQLSLHEVPNILTIVLKRFQKGQYGKINKYVTFPETLDMSPFVTGTADYPPVYFLYAVVVHLDSQNASSYSGHYVSYIKDFQGTWFRINDAEIQAVPMSQVMSEGAYMLFYSRPFPRPPAGMYLEQATAQAAPPPLGQQNHSFFKAQRSSRHGAPEEETCDTAADAVRRGMAPFLRSSSSAEFSDTAVSSSDWSLFTSSDESSFTTESTRDSFSAADHAEAAASGPDPISSLFGHYYCPEEFSCGNGGSGGVSCSKAAVCRPP